MQRILAIAATSAYAQAQNWTTQQSNFDMPMTTTIMGAPTVVMSNSVETIPATNFDLSAPTMMSNSVQSFQQP